MGADTEALQERGRRLGREAGEVLVVRRDFLSQGKPATGKRPEGVLGGCGGRVERARSEGGAAREQTVIGEGVEGFSQVGVASARARAMTRGGVARRPASHARYDSGDTPSIAANAACDWPSTIRHSRSVRGSTTSHHDIGAGQCEARSGGRAYFSQPILEGDRSLFSPAPSPPVPRQWAQSANSLGKWRARQDSNLRPSA